MKQHQQKFVSDFGRKLLATKSILTTTLADRILVLTMGGSETKSNHLTIQSDRKSKAQPSLPCIQHEQT